MFYSVSSKQEIKLLFKLYALQLFPLFNYVNSIKEGLEIESRVVWQ